MQLLEHFEELSLHPKNAEELKRLILQLAIQGNLTTNWRSEHPDVEHASFLLERIAEQKDQLITAKKLKKAKGFDTLEKKDELFNAPEKWKWCRLGEITSANTGYAFKSKDYKEKGVFISRVTNISSDGYISMNKAVYIDKVSANSTYLKFHLQLDDVLLVMVGGSLGKIGKVRENTLPSVLNQNQWKFDRYDGMDSDFLIQCLKYINRTQVKITKSTHGHLGQREYLSNLIPLPPLEEQKTIVAIVNQLFAEVEQLEELTKARISLKENFAKAVLQRLTQADNTTQEWNFLQQHFSSFFTEKANIKKLRESILQLAVQGKLTTKWRRDNSNVEPASELLKRIAAEKKQFIKEKKVKKEKLLPPIENEDMPYELPDSWVWCRLGEYVYCGRGKFSARPRNDPQFYGGKYPFIQIGDLCKDGGVINNHRQTLNEKGLNVSKIFPEGTIAVAIVGATIGGTSILGYDMCFPDSLVGIKPSPNYDSNYVEYYLRSKKMEFREISYAGGGQPNIKLPTLNEAYFPLPTLAEQQVIVKKVNALMVLCDELERQVETSQTQIEQLMQSCLREVFEGKKELEKV